jgi:hypothetical protein
MTEVHKLIKELADALEVLQKEAVTTPHLQIIVVGGVAHPVPIGNDLLARDALYTHLLNRARAYLAQPEPVPVAERPWEREGWCDADGRCWWGRPSEELCNSDWFLATRAEAEEFCDCSPPVVSLPHHALPIPTTRKDD